MTRNQVTRSAEHESGSVRGNTRGTSGKGFSRQRIAAAVIGLAVVIVGASILFTRHGGAVSKPPAPVSTMDANQRACIMVDSGDSALAAVAAGVDQAAADDGHLNVQQFTIPPGTTDAGSYLRSLIQQRCGVVVSVGQVAGAATAAYLGSGQAGPVHFIVVSQSPVQSAGVLNIPVSAVSAQVVSADVTELVK